MTWILLFIGAAIPLDRLLPWIAAQLRTLDSTLDKPKPLAIHHPAPSVLALVVLLTILKGWAAWTLGLYFIGNEWGAGISVGVAVVGHTWSVFSEGNHPSPFWVLFGALSAINIGTAFMFIAAVLGMTILTNISCLGLIGATILIVVMGGLPGLDSTVSVSIIGATIVASLPHLIEVLSNDPPTLFRQFQKRP